MKIKFNIDSESINAIERLTDILSFEISDDGIELNFVLSDRLGVSFKNGVGAIFYTKKHQIFRELGVFIQNAKEKKSLKFLKITALKQLVLCLIP